MMRASGIQTCAGFSLLELLVSLAVSLLVTSAVFAMLDPANGAFHTQPESADVAQRLRAAADALGRDLIGAGSGPLLARSSPVDGDVPPIFPYRVGRRNPDPAGTFDPSTISVWEVHAVAPQATLAGPLPSASGVATIAPGAGCVEADPSCGFRAGTIVAAFDDSGTIDFYAVSSVAGPALTLVHHQPDASRVHASSTLLAEVTQRTYFTRFDPGLGYAQLRRYDGGAGADVPVVDHVASLAFEYYGDPHPPRLTGIDPARTTYGPAPPASTMALTAYPAGENCAFSRTPAGELVPRLAVLSSDVSLVRLPGTLFTDGPWCPDETSPGRYDADLLRVRQVVATIRVESAIDALRGPAGVLFQRAGTARGTRWVPDREARVVVALRMVTAGR